MHVTIPLLGDAILLHNPTDLRLPDLGRPLHGFFICFVPKTGTLLVIIGCISGNALEAESHHARLGDYVTTNKHAIIFARSLKKTIEEKLPIIR